WRAAMVVRSMASSAETGASAWAAGSPWPACGFWASAAAGTRARAAANRIGFIWKLRGAASGQDARGQDQGGERPGGGEHGQHGGPAGAEAALDDAGLGRVRRAGPFGQGAQGLDPFLHHVADLGFRSQFALDPLFDHGPGGLPQVVIGVEAAGDALDR